MRTGAILSLSFHMAVVVLAWTGLPYLFGAPEEPERAIPIEVVSLTEALEAAPPEPAKKKPAPPKARAKPPPPPPPQATPPPPTEIATAVPEPLPPPEPVKVKPPPPVEPKPVAKPKPAPPAPTAVPTLVPQPRARKKPQPKPLDRMASVLRTVEELKDSAPPPRPEETVKAETASIDEARRLRTLRDEVQRQIEPCWNVRAGAKDAKAHVVELRIEVNPDGRVRAVQILDRGRFADDPSFRAAAEAATRAVLNPRCNPLKNLPLDTYGAWQTMTLRFDPKHMIGS